MSHWRLCKRRDFIHRLRRLGFDGPFSATRHQFILNPWIRAQTFTQGVNPHEGIHGFGFMLYEVHRLAIPSNHEYSVPQLRVLLREVAELLGHDVSADEWEKIG